MKTYDMHARHYRPEIGRFLSRDQYASAAGDQALQADPLTQNRYAFAGANPTTNIEFDGHEPITSFNRTGQQRIRGRSGRCLRGCGLLRTRQSGPDPYYNRRAIKPVVGPGGRIVRGGTPRPRTVSAGPSLLHAGASGLARNATALIRNPPGSVKGGVAAAYGVSCGVAGIGPAATACDGARQVSNRAGVGGDFERGERSGGAAALALGAVGAVRGSAIAATRATSGSMQAAREVSEGIYVIRGSRGTYVGQSGDMPERSGAQHTSGAGGSRSGRPTRRSASV